LFEQFDGDIQKEIELLFGQLTNILQESCNLLERHYGSKDSSLPQLLTSNLSSTSTTNTSGHHPSIHRKSSPSFPSIILWSFRDKKRVESIVHEFNDQNGRIHEKIKLWCLASQLGVNIQHLERLQQDVNSKRLGFDVDATLRLAQWDAQNDTSSLELRDPSWDQSLKAITQIPDQGLFAMFIRHGKVMIQENHPYEESRSSGSDPGRDPGRLDARTESRVDSLAKLLHQPKEQVFRIPPCVGWKYLPSQKAIAFVFEVQSRPVTEPVSLLRLLSSSDLKPELGDKFRLALGLARCISQLHMVKWASSPV
jgi:hypothetical protein